MIKANKYYVNIDDLFLDKNNSIKSNQCTEISIKFTVDARHIVLAILEMFTFEPVSDKDCTLKTVIPNPSKKNVEKELRKQLMYQGDKFLDRIESGLEEYCNIDEILPEAIKIAQRLFPEFMGVPNSMDFILTK